MSSFFSCKNLKSFQMSDGGGGKAVHVFFIYDPPRGGECVPGTPPVRSMTGPACAAGCVSFFPGPKPRAGSARRVRRANAGRVLPVPGGRLDERTAGRHVCHVCVIIVS